MKQALNEQEVIRLLTSLKNAENEYPPDLLKSRREMFIQQSALAAASMNTALDVNNNGANAGGSSSSAPAASSSAPASIGTILQTVLIVAIVVEAGVATYLYRDKIAGFFSSVFSPRVEQIGIPPDQSSSPDNLPSTADAALTETPVPTMTDPSASTGETHSVTTPQNGGSNNAGTGSGGSNNPPAVSTPQPTKPGLHLGQTPKPDRTQPVPDDDNNREPQKDK